MAPTASILAATSAAAASSKRPADDTEPEQLLPADSSSSALPQVVIGDDASRSKSQQQRQCPRCRSTNTKFCYYNNYSASQPRHFCRACRRYWTHGGTLRDVPVGGATRHAKRRRVVHSDEPSLSASSPHTTTTSSQQANLSSTACFPFLSDGSYFLPQLDLGFFAPPAAFSSAAVLPDFYDGLAPWDDGTLAISGGAWPAADNIAGSLDFSWPPTGN